MKLFNNFSTEFFSILFILAWIRITAGCDCKCNTIRQGRTG